MPTLSPSVASQPATTITVGSGSPVNITVTPTISQSVELQCSRSPAAKQWYTAGSIVQATSGEVWTTSGPARKLGFSTFATSHAGTYSCRVAKGDITTFTVVLGKFVKLNVRRTYLSYCVYVQSYDSTHSQSYHMFKSRNLMYMIHVAMYKLQLKI